MTTKRKKKRPTKAASRRGRASIEKGKAAEREVAACFRELFPWCAARRRQQYSGSEGADDVVFLDGVHVECKRVEKLSIDAAMRQAESDAKDEAIPIVCHRRNRTPWLVTLKLEDLPDFHLLLLDARDRYVESVPITGAG